MALSDTDALRWQKTWLACCSLLDSNHDGKLEFDEAWGMFVKVPFFDRHARAPHTRTRTHARTHARARTHTHTQVCGGDLVLEGTLRLMPLNVYLAASTTAVLFESLA